MVVLHEHEIRKPKGPFTILFDADIRKRFMEDLTAIIADADFKIVPLPFSIVLANKQINSCGLPLADLVARPIGRKQLNPEQENRAYDVLETKFLRNLAGKIRGAGLESYP